MARELPMRTDNSIAPRSSREVPTPTQLGFTSLLCVWPFDLYQSIPAVNSRANGGTAESVDLAVHSSRVSSSVFGAARAMSAATADAGVYEEMLRVVEACTARIRWRLRPQSKRRLLNDILFLCTGLRSVVLMDYGGTTPQLQENLCSLLYHAQQESSILKPVKVMVIKDMLYLIHVKGLSEYASPNARSQHQLAFVDLEKSCCKLLSNTEENANVMELLSIQSLFSAKFPVDTSVNLPAVRPGILKQNSEFSERTINVDPSANEILLVDLSAYIDTTQVALPSLNGWLLGYPVIYLFCNGSAEVATQNLAKHSLHIYRVYVRRSCQLGAKQLDEELMCFSVPCEMSTKRGEEPWAKSFVARMNEKIGRCNEVWASLRLEIEVFQSQSQVIVL